jgi:hypothetical protein
MQAVLNVVLPWKRALNSALNAVKNYLLQGIALNVVLSKHPIQSSALNAAARCKHIKGGKAENNPLVPP